MLIISCMMQKKIFNFGQVVLVLIKSLLLYQILCSLMVSMSGCHPVDPGSNPISSSKLFSFLIFFPGLSQNFTKNRSWNSRCADFFRMNIKILTTRVLKKWSELTKVTWKIVQLNLKSNSILLISQLLNYRFSKVRPFLESMEYRTDAYKPPEVY